MTKRVKAAIPRREDAAVYTDLLWMTLPLLAFSTYLYGPRCLTLYGVALVTANLCDRLVALLRRRPFESREFSNEAFAAMLMMLMPASVSYYVVVVSVVALVLVGKEAFGGYGAYIFHPTAVGYALAAISWPEQVCRYPQPFNYLPLIMTEEPTGLSESVFATLRSNGIPNVSALNLFLGNYAGPMGASAVMILAAAALYLRVRRRLSLRALGGFWGTYILLFWIMPRLGGIPLSMPWEYLPERLEALIYELLGGSVLFAGVFLLCDPYTVPKHPLSRLLFGIMLAIFTLFYSYYGSYEAGVCFAFLFANCVSGWVDRMVIRHGPGRGRKEART
ncbi:RnfABCDGE type electron transport complex subunit D [Fournierella massiliensis]|nr:RnfABCDGE type electron transport complex subunit D [Fournierella massiliensis]MCF2557186.1 RnfABCDGE type electron transport complex subunit D [Fournierella massiliensis]